MLLPIFDDGGASVKAHFSVTPAGPGWHLIMESRTGRINTPSERNAEYAEGFRILLRRIAKLRLTITDAIVDSHNSVVQGLRMQDRRLNSSDLEFPLLLDVNSDADGIAALLRRAQASIGSRRTKGAGNTTRRVRLVLAKRSDTADIVDLGAQLSNGSALGPVTEELIEEAAAEAGAASGFDPSSLEDARRRVLAAIAVRQGQAQFRKLLLTAYGGRCAITDCDLEEALEAAHIIAYLGKKTNHVQNGLLLRADLHSLFDRGLLGIHPPGWTVVLHSRLEKTQYGFLQGRRIALPLEKGARPSPEALYAHLQAAGLLSTERSDTS
jgi:hypothetical protein